MDNDLFYSIPTPTEADWAEYARIGFEPLFFEWYKFVISILNVLSAIQPDSPNFHCTDPRHYYVLSGLLHRCVRLMFANVALSGEGAFGETTSIVDRCICETAIKIEWLCQRDSSERIVGYLKYSLRPELEFSEEINAKIMARGAQLPIESRMLKSIENHIGAAGVTREEISGCKKLPDLAAMLADLGEQRLSYVIVQRMGSHHIHGTWPSLLTHYLSEMEDFPGYRFSPRHNSVTMPVSQYVYGCIFVLQAAIAYSSFFLEAEDADSFSALCADTLREIIEHHHRALGAE